MCGYCQPEDLRRAKLERAAWFPHPAGRKVVAFGVMDDLANDAPTRTTNASDAAALVTLGSSVQALLPLIRDEAAEGEVSRQLTPRVVAALEQSGVLSVLSPKAVGGAELDVATLLNLGVSIGRADTSTAWIAMFYGLHSWLAALFPAEAQAALFGTAAHVMAPATFSPTGRAALAAEGHYMLSGRWQWGTGVQHATWAMVAALVRSDPSSPPTDLRLFALPIHEVTVEDTWFTSGMCATGSNDLVIVEAEVPAVRSVSFTELLDGTAPGTSLHQASLYRWPLAAILSLGACAPALGTALGVLDGFEERVQTRRLAYIGTLDRDRGATRARVANGRVRLEAASLLLTNTAAGMDRRLAAGEVPSLEHRAHARMVAAEVVRVSRDVVADIGAASGASAQMRVDPLQRAMRDLATLSGHVVFDHDATAELYGTIALGQDPPLALL